MAIFAAFSRCFLFGVVFCLLLFVLIYSVMPQILLVFDFVGVSSVFIYPKIKTALNGFILPCTDIPIFYHFSHFYYHFLPFCGFSVRGRLKRSASFFGF